MGEYITLLGADDVKSAGSRMAAAANEMQRAAASFEDTLFRHRQFMDDWLARLEFLMAERKEESDDLCS